MAKVLIVDDSRLSVMALQNMIMRLGHDIVGTAFTGEEAIEKAKMLKPEVVTLDFVMPDIDGRETAKKMKMIDPRIKIIMITNDELPSHVKQEIRASAYIRKPITSAKLKQGFSQL